MSVANSLSVKHNTILSNFKKDLFDYGFVSNGINYLVSFLMRAQCSSHESFGIAQKPIVRKINEMLSRVIVTNHSS